LATLKRSERLGAAAGKCDRSFRLLPEWKSAPVDVSIVFPSRRELSPTIRAFVVHEALSVCQHRPWRRFKRRFPIYFLLPRTRGIVL